MNTLNILLDNLVTGAIKSIESFEDISISNSDSATLIEAKAQQGNMAFDIKYSPEIEEFCNKTEKHFRTRGLRTLTQELRNSLEIKTIEPTLTLGEALKICTILAEECLETNNNFYGVILFRNGRMGRRRFFANPLHPLSMTMLRELDTNIDKFGIHIYTIENINIKKYFSEKMQEQDVSDLRNMYLSLIRSITEKKQIYNKRDNIRELISDDNDIIGLTYDIHTFNENGESIDEEIMQKLVPTQLLIKNRIMYPYYGMIIHDINTGKARELGHVMHPNVGSFSEEENVFLSACTGSETRASIQGSKTLCDANLDSSYKDAIISRKFLNENKILMQIAIELYNGEHDSGKVIKCERLMTLENFVEFFGLTRLDYLEYIKGEI